MVTTGKTKDAIVPTNSYTVDAKKVLVLGENGDSRATSVNPLPVTDAGTQYTQALDYAGGSQPVYVGEAVPGTSKGAVLWRIKKLTYSGTSVTDIQWADGTAAFTKEWDNRTGYTYS